VLSRRRLLTLAGTSLGAAAGVGFYTWRIEPRWLEIVRRSLFVRALPPRLAGRTLVQISDVHVGPRVDDAYVLATFRRVADPIRSICPSGTATKDGSCQGTRTEGSASHRFYRRRFCPFETGVTPRVNST
jgi:hypothetical protein